MLKGLGYKVYQNWVNARQACLAPLMRTARGFAARQQPELAACGVCALVELQRLCQMPKRPPREANGGHGTDQQPQRGGTVVWGAVAQALLGDGQRQG